MLATLVGFSGIGKGELARLTKIVTRRLKLHDAETLQKYLAYQKVYEKQKGTNKSLCPFHTTDSYGRVLIRTMGGGGFRIFASSNEGRSA